MAVRTDFDHIFIAFGDAAALIGSGMLQLVLLYEFSKEVNPPADESER